MWVKYEKFQEKLKTFLFLNHTLQDKYNLDVCMQMSS